MKPDLVSGSPLWQAVFVSIAVLLLLLQVIRGWRLGLPRQLVRLGALVAAYGTALFGGQAALPFLRPLLKVPDFALSAIGGAILATIVYFVINTVGTILFKRTDQQSSGGVRVVWGISGAALGFVFGLFFIWIMIIGIRMIGAVAEAQINARAPERIEPLIERPLTPRAQARRTPTEVPDQNSLTFSLARLKKSVELGAMGEVVKQADVVPAGVYDTLTKVGELASKPERASRFLSYPGVVELTENPKILALRADPEVVRMLEEGRFWDLVQDDRLIEAANDPELRAQLKKFDLKKALEYATKPE